jgi:hypothetical protein
MATLGAPVSLPGQIPLLICCPRCCRKDPGCESPPSRTDSTSHLWSGPSSAELGSPSSRKRQGRNPAWLMEKSLLAVLFGETKSKCSMHANSVTEPPPGSPHRAHTKLLKNLKVTTGHPGSRAKCLAVLSGATAQASHMGIRGPHIMYPVHQSCPHQLAKSQ